MYTAGLDTSKPNADIERKWFDSLIGYDDAGRIVPDPNLSAKEKYGILNDPRQSWFLNKTEALKQVIDRANIAQSQTNPHLKEPSTSDGWVSKSSKLLQLGEIRAALESIERALYLDNANSEAWLLKAKLLAAGENQSKEALQAIRRASGLGEYTVLLESEILENEGKLESARAVLEEWLETNPDDAEVRGRLSLVLFSMCLMFKVLLVLF